jgi:acetyltransferase-like isoleucine patch superfamily enzyme
MDADKVILGLVSFVPSSAWKAKLYRMLGAEVGENVHIAPRFILSCPRMSDVRLGDSSSFGFDTKVLCGSIDVGRRVRIGGDCNIRGEGSVVVGDDVFIGVGCILDCKGELVIEEGVQIAPGAQILTHDTSGNFYCSQPIVCQRTEILARAYVGAGAIILPGVVVGSEAIVGAGAVVTKNVPAGATVVGIPARVVNQRNQAAERRAAGA